MKKHNNPVPTNAIILENLKGQILLVKRKKAPYKNFWDVPGGFIGYNESLEESTIREIREELGFNLKEFSYLFSYPDIYSYQGVREKILVLMFRGKIENEKLRASDDVSSYKFFRKDNIPFSRIAFSGLKKALKDYLNLGRPKR